ncbi:cation:proton antiporter [Actinomyces culturomici]|uniref:cation:proton antiporter n=1 Tax=Actinomyces culturomici TaxID=1926276 RepID=UPI000E20B1BE|nr:sodium:proton antiporter [Actinomyces culturomici]
MDLLVVSVAGLLAIAVCAQLSPRIGVASPLILLALGAGIGFLPWVSPIELSPAIVLEVILPPLLFGAAASMPVMDFRRELTAVAGLAIGLVVLTAVALGLLVHALVPAIPIPWAVALGAVLSPTDAVAVSIAKGQGVSHRIITILEGEGLFNDATALVLLSSATAAALQVDADALAPMQLGFDFLLALAVAIAVGLAVGELGIRIRSRITQPAADTVFSFVMPFLASIPAEHLGGSGLVAAVVAGLVVSHRRAAMLPAMNRRFAQQNWRTVELVLEGVVFLTMGLQAFGIVEEVSASSVGLRIGRAALVSLAVGALAIVLRAAFVAPFLAFLAHRRRHTRARYERNEEKLQMIEERIAHACDVDDELLAARNMSKAKWDKAVRQWHRRLERVWRKQRRRGNDLAYVSREPLGPREGAVVVWAGMRGAVTLAAAQTLPLSAPARAFLLLIALLVAAGSLAIQGLTLPLLIRLVKPLTAEDSHDDAERDRLLALLGSTLKESALAQAMSERSGAPRFTRIGSSMALTRAHPHDGDEAVAAPSARESGEGETLEGEVLEEGSLPPLTESEIKLLAIEAIREQREALMEARDEGVFSSAALEHALERLDHEEIMLTSLY